MDPDWASTLVGWNLADDGGLSRDDRVTGALTTVCATERGPQSAPELAAIF